MVIARGLQIVPVENEIELERGIVSRLIFPDTVITP
jgi:hypothetical protein